MEVFLIRHAPAVPRSSARSEETRALSPESRRKWARAVRGLGRLGVTFDRLYHGSSLCALGTADELSTLVRGETVVTTYFAERPAQALLEEVAGQRVALVGHDPWLGSLLAWLLLGTQEQGKRFSLGKGDVAWLEGQPRSGGMTLRALLPQRTLRKLGA
jgi:phosphohistidine phosphatase